MDQSVLEERVCYWNLGIGVGCFLFLISLLSIYFSFVVMFMGGFLSEFVSNTL